MELKIETGAVTLPVLRDGTAVGELVINPMDVAFANKFYTLLGTVQDAQTQLQTALQGTQDAAQRLALLSGFCTQMRTGIDDAFGSGTAQLVFGSAAAPAMLVQFFTAVAEVVSEARADKLAAYTADTDEV